MRANAWVAVALALFMGACATYSEHLNRGQRLYDENEFERSLAIWRDLERDIDSLSLNDQARYAYLRGMTDYRLGFRADARHWLAVARAIDEEHPGGLQSDWKTRLGEALTDLNKDVYGGAESVGTASAATSASAAPTDTTAPAAATAPPPAPPATP